MVIGKLADEADNALSAFYLRILKRLNGHDKKIILEALSIIRKYTTNRG